MALDGKCIAIVAEEDFEDFVELTEPMKAAHLAIPETYLNPTRL